MLSELPDVRDGLTRAERVVLRCLSELQAARGTPWVSSAELYGRVSEHLPLTPAQLQRLLQKLGAGAGEPKEPAAVSKRATTS